MHVWMGAVEAERGGNDHDLSIEFTGKKGVLV
jgi:hypothetical protein